MRLFVGLALAEAVREEIGKRIAGSRRKLPAARWTPPENLHLTLVFLGEVEGGAVEPLGAALTAALAPHPPLTLRVAGAGCFPPPPPRGKARPARVAWLGIEVDEGVERLGAVQAAAAEAVRGTVALPDDDRPFSPHLTIARPREPWREDAIAAFTAAFSPPAGDAFVVDHARLVASELGRGPGGAPLYRDLLRLPLAGGAAGGPR